MNIDLTLVLNQVVWGAMVGIGYTLMAMAFSLIYATSRTINFAIGEFAMLAAYFCYTLLAKVPVEFVGPALVSLFAVAVLAMVIERLAFRRLYSLDPILILIGTIGLSSILKNLALVIWGPFSFSFPAYFQIRPTYLGPVMFIPQNVIVTLVGIAAMIGFDRFMRKTRTGTAMRATAQNVRGAKLVGINTDRCINLSWGIGAMLAAISGIMMAFAYNISLDMGTTLNLKGFTAAIFGGLGSIPASVGGGVLLGVVENVAAIGFDYSYKDVVAFAVIVLVMLTKPQGLFVRSGSSRRV
ncbi:branched-chain amino acid ABC transporter permease [Rhizobium leguminosarum]